MSVNIINILYLRQYANKKVKIVRFWPVKMIMCFIISIFLFMLGWFVNDLDIRKCLVTLHHARPIEGHPGAVLAGNRVSTTQIIKIIPRRSSSICSIQLLISAEIILVIIRMRCPYSAIETTEIWIKYDIYIKNKIEYKI